MVILKDEKILDSWSSLIENAQGKAEELYGTTLKFIKESQAPGVKVERVKVSPSCWQEFLAGKGSI